MGKEEELENWNKVKYRIHEEGMEYCFMHYSDFSEIKDKKFHKKRLAYIKINQDLSEYINKKINKLDYY